MHDDSVSRQLQTDQGLTELSESELRFPEFQTDSYDER